MKAKVLGFSVVLALLLLVTRAPREQAAPASSPASEPARASSDAAPAPLAGPAPLANLPQLSSHRVSEQVTDAGMQFGGVKYQAEVDAQGLRFATRGHEVRLKGAAIDQGGVAGTLKDSPAKRDRFAQASIDRGAMTEVYVFENTRVEQLFRIHEALGEGALRVHVQVEGNLKGDLEAIPSRQGVALGTLEDGSRLIYDGALAYDAAGRREALQPRMENGRIVLEVSAGFMAKAEWPVVVDPWLEIDLSATLGGVSETPTVSQTPALAIEGGGNPYLAWAEEVGSGATKRFKIYLRYWNGFEWRSHAESFGGNGLSGTTGNATNPSIAITPSGEVFVAWQDDSSGNFEIYLKKWTGTAWIELNGSATNGGVSNSSGESYFPSVAYMTTRAPSTQAISTVPVVAWQDTSTGPTQIHLAAFFPGDAGRADEVATATFYENFPIIPAGWYTPGDIGPVSTTGISATPAGFVSERPKLHVSEGAGGTARTISLVWQDTRGGDYDIIFAQGTLANDPTTFTFVPPIPGPIDPNQSPAYDGQTQPIWARTAVAFPRTDVSGTATLSVYPSLAIDGGNIWIAWEEGIDLTHSQIRVSRNLAASVTASIPLLGDHRSTTPSIAASGGFAYVAWADDEPGNTEIYVKRSAIAANGPWTSVGFDPSFGISSTGLGGISRTFGASLFPVVKAGASVSIAWQDFSNGSFDTYLRRFYENEPRSLRQTTAAAASVIAFGGSTTSPVVELRGQVFSEDIARTVLMEVEIRPIGSAFVGRDILTGELIPVSAVDHIGTSEAVIVFSGAVNTQYHWRARTVDDIGRRSAWVSAGPNLDGDLDFSVSAIPPVPPVAPSNLTAAANGLQINLTWSAPPGGQTLTYHVYRSTTSPVTLVAGNRIASGLSSVSYSDINSLSPGTPYFYVVTAVDIANQESLGSNEATATTPSAPGTLTGLVATAGPSQISLTWIPVAGATSYTVLRRGPMPTAAAFAVIASGVTLPTYTDTGLPPSTTFEYQVFAVNGVGNGAVSATASATTPVLTVSAPPTTLAGTAGSGQAFLTWNSPIGGPYSFNVYRSSTSGGPYTAVATGVPTTSYTDSGLTGSSSYYYVVTAVNGLGESTYSNQILVTTPPTLILILPTIPSTPTSPTAVAGAGRVFLSWTASSGSLPIEYVIGRSTTSGGPYTEVGRTQGTTTFADTSAPQGTPVFYVIFATNAAGDGALSAEVGATVTLAAISPPVNLVGDSSSPSSISLSWIAPTGSGLVVYNIKRSATSGGPYTTIATGVAATSYTATSSTTEVFYVVTAQNGLGESVPSNEVQDAKVPFEGESKDNCGLLGVEFLLVMGALALRRRRTRA